LAFYQGISQNHDWTDIPSGPLIRPGQQDERLEAIQRRLSITGEAPARVMLVEVYDDELVSAVKTFQSLHGLNPDGIIGPKTRAWLSKSPQDLANIIRVNMARWRWQSHELGKSRTYIIVNIAGFSLTAVQEGTPVLEMPVIVGKLQHRTPVFSDTIQYLDFNPFWNIPPQIARDEELPALRKNPRHLADRHVRVFSSWQSDAVELDSLAIDWKTIGRSRMSAFKLRQDPGPWNALGRVKFVFPNNHSVYLHDTPTQDLFEQTVRTFSHGCIRVSNPLKLASFCLNQQPGSWSESEISRIMADRDRMVINLKNALPIHITYQTSWLDKNGTIHFSSDIYGRDKRLQDALKNR
jgi:murein L,D-transpeptidase YcbB/YkuD